MNEATLHHRNFLLHLRELAGYEQPVLIKESAREEPAPSHIAQLHNEYAVTKRLYDLIIEGVSLVKNYRTQFREIIAKDSPEKLLDILREKVKQG